MSAAGPTSSDTRCRQQIHDRLAWLGVSESGLIEHVEGGHPIREQELEHVVGREELLEPRRAGRTRQPDACGAEGAPMGIRLRRLGRACQTQLGERGCQAQERSLGLRERPPAGRGRRLWATGRRPRARSTPRCSGCPARASPPARSIERQASALPPPRTAPSSRTSLGPR